MWKASCYTIVYSTIQFQLSDDMCTGADVIKRVEARLGGPLDEVPSIHKVRDVAPNKYHVCVSFRVPENVAFYGRTDLPEAKRQKV